MYVDEARLRRMFDEADLDRSGGIDLGEFEILVQRLMAPTSVLANRAHRPLPPPASGSAVAAVFRAFVRGSSGCMAASDLPAALRLLDVDPDEV